MTTKRIALRPTFCVSVLGLLALVVGGCATRETEIQKAAKDWCMTIRGCQVIPVYPLTEDIQPGDIFLVQVPIDRQQDLYRAQGFLALDNHLARLNPSGYDDFYANNFFRNGSTNRLLSDWIRPSGTNLSWQAAPHAAFPSYTFSVRNGAGLSLGVPIQGVPVGLSLLASDAASGSVQIQDAHTVGVDTLSLYRQVQQWAEANRAFLQNFGSAPESKKKNYLRVVSRLYTAGRLTVSLKDASNRSGGLDAGVPKPVNLLTPELPASSTNLAGNALQNYTNAFDALSRIVAAAAPSDAAGNLLPGGSLRLAAASARTVSIDETFDPALSIGYLGFDCAIEADGGLGAPIPTHANLNPDYRVEQFEKFKTALSGNIDTFDQIKNAYNSAPADRKAAIRQKALELRLLPEAVDDARFIRVLRRSVDPNSSDITARFRTLAEFASQSQ